MKSCRYDVKPSKKPRIFEKSELLNMYSGKEDYSDCSVDLRKNIFILSTPSGIDNNAVFNLLQQRMSETERAIIAMTRKPRVTEKDGIDYYVYTLDELKKIIA